MIRFSKSNIGLLFVILAFTALSTNAATGSYSQDPKEILVFSIPEKTQRQALTPYLEFQKEYEPYGNDVLSRDDFLSRFQPIAKKEPNFGYVEGAYWFRLNIQDHQASETMPSNWYLELDYPFLDDIQAFIPRSDGRFDKIVTGDTHPFHTRKIDVHSYVFPVTLRNDQPQSIFFRIHTSTSLQIPLVLWSNTGFVENNTVKQYWHGIFYGIMIVMVLYNFFIYLSVKDKAYILYILYITFVMLTNMVITGVAFQKLWPNSPAIANMSYPIVAPITMFLALMFTRSFLRTQHYGLYLDLVMKWLSVLTLVMLSFPFVLGQYTATLFAVFMPIPVCLTIIFCGFYGVVKRERRAYFFAAAWSSLAIGFIARALLQFDVLPANIFTLYGSHIGSIAEVILLSLALADRINIEKAEKFEAVEAALSSYQKQQKMEKKLVFQSLHDQLTGAPNRSLFVQRLRELIGESVRTDRKLLVCTIHLNNFHDINFTLGHQAGDKILIEAVHKLDRDIAKWKGVHWLDQSDQGRTHIGIMEGVYLSFILSCHKEDSELDLLAPLTKKLSKPFHFEDMTLDLGGHLGVSVWPHDDEKAEGLTRKSMIAVRAARWSKLPMVCYDTNIDKYSEIRLSLMGELITAIENNELVLHYQPKIDLKTGEVVSMEALVRWQHPKLGLLGPGHFVDIAESTGIIQPLTYWVLNQAIAYCGSLREKGHKLSVAVNLSVRNLLNEQFTTETLRTIDQWHFPRDQLILEVVESMVIEDMEQAIKTLEELNQQGIRISLDDYGTGYSSLKYLKKLPIKELKLDRSFVTDLVTNKDDEVIVETTLAIAKQLRLKTVAEGIEDMATQTKLMELDCEFGQGYHIQKPLPADEFISWLEKQKEDA